MRRERSIYYTVLNEFIIKSVLEEMESLTLETTDGNFNVKFSVDYKIN